ncbi:MAG: hypothetical protein JNM93_13060 [Bacteriovoracaceae bacterium]|nr:hypothetical protein [Bacteriovoracaceae bacterium]
MKLTIIFLISSLFFLAHAKALTDDERISALMISNGTAEKEKYCPNDFTEIEMDGLVTQEDAGNKDAKRVILARLCGELTSYSDYKPLKTVKLKTKPCSCIYAQMGDFEAKEIKDDWEFPSKDEKGNYKCELMKYHVSCHVMQTCGEGCASGDIQCPLKCVEYK